VLEFVGLYLVQNINRHNLYHNHPNRLCKVRNLRHTLITRVSDLTLKLSLRRRYRFQVSQIYNPILAALLHIEAVPLRIKQNCDQLHDY
jgi:hypothetical protein